MSRVPDVPWYWILAITLVIVFASRGIAWVTGLQSTLVLVTLLAGVWLGFSGIGMYLWRWIAARRKGVKF